jgi:hypothetical protein
VHTCVASHAGTHLSPQILFVFCYFLSVHRNAKPVLGPRIAFYDIASPYQEERNYVSFILFCSLSFLTQSSFLCFPFYFLPPVKTPTSGLTAMSHHSANPCRRAKAKLVDLVLAGLNILTMTQFTGKTVIITRTSVVKSPQLTQQQKWESRTSLLKPILAKIKTGTGKRQTGT